MVDRDDQILNHIGRYRVSIRAVIEELFFDGATCDHVLQRLSNEKRINTFRRLPGRLSYYQLSLTEARHRGIPGDRAGNRTSYSLREALAVLWFCCMSEKPRRRVELKELSEFGIPETHTNKPHCSEFEEGRGVIYRIFTPSPGAREDYLFVSLKRDAVAVLEQPELKDWAAAGAYAFAVLFETEGRLIRFKRRLETDTTFPVQVHLSLVPGPHRLAYTIRLRQTNHPRPAPPGHKTSP
jgi:hypothetical protein